MVALLKNELGIEADLKDGKLGEFSVLVGGKDVAQKGLIRFPGDNKIICAVQKEMRT